MTLIVQRGNPIKSSKFYPQIKALGLKVLGVVYVNDEQWECHKCGGKNPKTTEEQLTKCSTCDYPFLVIVI